MSRYERHHCSNCERERRFRKPAPQHYTHLGLTLGTLGLWLPVWLAVARQCSRRRWRCTYCQSALRPDAPAVSSPAS
jgi:hypothetical protein